MFSITVGTLGMWSKSANLRTWPYNFKKRQLRDNGCSDINIQFLNDKKAEADREEYKFRMILDNDDFDYSISPPVVQVRVITTIECIF